MTEVRKPGANSKVASMPFVFQLETQTVTHQWFSDIFFLHISVTSSNLKIGLEVPKASGKLQKK